MPCPLCAAPYPDAEACREQFNAGQFLELENPAGYAVHHLSVPCYFLQHNTYSREGWLAGRELLRRFLLSGLTPEEARREAQTSVHGPRRTWNFTKGPKLAGVEQISWTLTVADVRLDSAEHYCADVRRWAAAILSDTAELVRGVGADA